MTAAHSCLRGVSVLCVSALLHLVAFNQTGASTGCPCGWLLLLDALSSRGRVCVSVCALCSSAPCCRVKQVWAGCMCGLGLLGIVGRLASTTSLYAERPSVCVSLPETPMQEEAI